jgi:3-isopropylmalate/(R)-2-methylmalate dehydratase small subunit
LKLKQKWHTINLISLPVRSAVTNRKCRYRSNYPCSFLKATERVGFGTTFSVTGDTTMILQNDFVLNNNLGKILVGGKNFGSGSSREHAAWAVYDYGFDVLFFFADILKLFKHWCFTSSSKPEFADAIFKAIEADPKRN